jgi:hypothetical protein
MHVYPGIVNNELYFFVLPSGKDKSTISTSEIFSSIQQCPIQTLTLNNNSNGLGAPISPLVAQQRVSDWANYNQNWINANIGTSNSIFSVFSIPQDDITTGAPSFKTFLALEANSSAPGGYLSDILLEEVIDGNTAYYDTAFGYPPFASTPGRTANDFYLLSLI